MREPRMLRLSRVIAVLQSPIVVPQARRLRRVTPLLPDAAPPWAGVLEAERIDEADRTGEAERIDEAEHRADGAHPSRTPPRPPLRLVVLGDSTAAGVGVSEQSEGLPGGLATELVRRTGRDVSWRAVGENGATSLDIRERFLDAAVAHPVDLLFLTVGANDALGLRSAAAFRRDLREILTTFSRCRPEAVVLVSSLPMFQRFELLPDPLRTALYRHSRSLERVARRVAAADERWIMTGPPPPYSDDFFADDLFHPSASGYRDWAEWAVANTWDLGLDRLAR